MKKLLSSSVGLILLLMLIMGCSNMRTVTLNTMRPAEISFPSDVNTLLVVDRSKFEKEAVNIIEGILTGELPGEDRSGVQALITSFQTQLTYSPRFQTKVADERLAGNSLTSAFPEQLPWTTVRALCDRYGAEVVVSIEIFDTDFNVTNGKRRIKKEVVVDDETREVEVDQYYAEGLGNAIIGIRLYDLQAETIVDQQLLRRTHTWEAAGSTLNDALAQLVSKSEATRYLSSRVGSDFAYKIAPMPIRITRSFYGKSRKAPAMDQGSRYADVGQWEEAADIWEKGIRQAPVKEAGRLAYNVAVAYEVLGDFEKAIEWAQKAYVQYGNKKAREYVTKIEDRLYAEEVAREQMQ